MFAFFLVSLSITQALTSQLEINALRSLYDSTAGDHWLWQNESLYGPKWSFTSSHQSDPCNDENKVWQGITCSSPPNMCSLTEECVIVSLQLQEYGLVGSLPPEMFILLTSLTNLQITSSQQLTGLIPTTIGSLTTLKFVILKSNDFSGPISGFCQLENLIALDLSFNRFSGSIPSEIAHLQRLRVLYLFNNQLFGSIPIQIGSLSELVWLALDNNQFVGTIPSELTDLNLSELYLDNNLLSGSISELFFLTRLTRLDLFSNSFTGTIPSQIGFVNKLTSLSLYSNQLSGSIPTEIGSLNQIEYFDVTDNCFLNSIPSEILGLENLQFLYLNENYLTSTIPSQFGVLTKLQQLSFANNFLTGSIPSSMSQLTSLLNFHVFRNHLVGGISFSLQSFPYLQQFFVHQNHLTGDLHQLLPSFLDSSSQSHLNSLVNLDVSNNLFSGSIPSSIYLFPNLRSVSLSLNCFQHKLPSSICEGFDIEVISMDGLRSADGCRSSLDVSFWLMKSVGLGRTLDGGIPQCVWLLSKLRTLNLAGNGLTGKIGSLSEMSSLQRMTLSHNYLSGVVPRWIQEKNMSQLDLSHNKLTGDVVGFKNQVLMDLNNLSFIRTKNYSKNKEFGRSLKLSINRLSGDLSNFFENYATLDILSGNLFSCQNIPSEDKNRKWITCESEEYDQTMIVMTGLLGFLFFFVLIYFCCLVTSYCHSSFPRNPKNLSTWLNRRIADYHLLMEYLNYYKLESVNRQEKEEEDSKMNASIISFGYLLSNAMKMICLITLVSLFFSLPVYLLKEISASADDEDGTGNPYITHSHMYRWLWTMAFLTGSLPAILVLILTFVSIISFAFLLNRLEMIQTQETPLQNSMTTSPTTSPPAPPPHLSPDSRLGKYHMPHVKRTHLKIKITVWMIFILNVAIVGTVNGLYLWSTLQNLSADVRICIQFSFGLFSILWSAVIRGSLSSKIKESRYGVWLLTCLSMTNNVVIPCLVTALSSPSCYQRLLVPPEKISSSYSYQKCRYFSLSLDEFTCLLYIQIPMSPLSLTPPFTYSYQCGSTLLTTYIPIYMYSMSLQLLSIFLKLFFIFSSHQPQYPQWFLKNFPGLYWPFLTENNSILLNGNSSKQIHLIKPYQIISSVTNNLILLLSFGLCSPVLGCYITFCICANLCYWLMLIGRFISVSLLNLSKEQIKRAGEEEGGEKAEEKERQSNVLDILNQQVHGVHSSLNVCKWPVISTSYAFMTLLCWDMVGDQIGWYNGLWVPIVGALMFLITWGLDVMWTTWSCNSLLPFSLLPQLRVIELVPSSIHQQQTSISDSNPSSSIGSDVERKELK